MNIVERICSAYPVEYFMMPEMSAMSVSLSFDDGISAALRESVTVTLENLGIFPDSFGMLQLTLACDDAEGRYILKKGDQVLYRFANRTRSIPFYEYDPTEAIAWVIYILSTNRQNDWLENCQGQYISCRVFSARQQITAERFWQCVHSQYMNLTASEELIRESLRSVTKFVSGYISQAPRFSCRPISPAAFSKLADNGTVETALANLTKACFGEVPFEEDIDIYRESLKKDPAYEEYVKQAVSMMIDRLYHTPIMSAARYFAELNAFISRMATEPDLPDMHKKVPVDCSCRGLKAALAEVDKAYDDYIRDLILKDFLQTVSEQTHARLNEEISEARREVARASNILKQFCFMQLDNEAGTIGWKQLVSPSDNDIYTPSTVTWTATLLSELQSTFREIYEPQLWLCAERLYNLAKNEQITAIGRTRPIKVQDEQYVWAIWADAKID